MGSSDHTICASLLYKTIKKSRIWHHCHFSLRRNIEKSRPAFRGPINFFDRTSGLILSRFPTTADNTTPGNFFYSPNLSIKVLKAKGNDSHKLQPNLKFYQHSEGQILYIIFSYLKTEWNKLMNDVTTILWGKFRQYIPQKGLHAIKHVLPRSSSSRVAYGTLLRTGHCPVRNGSTHFPDKLLKWSYVQIFPPTRCIKYVKYQLIPICHDQEKRLSLSLRTGHKKTTKWNYLIPCCVFPYKFIADPYDEDICILWFIGNC